MSRSWMVRLGFMVAPWSVCLAQGPLTPPGAPAPILKTLQQVEPRTPVNAVNTPGGVGATYAIVSPGSYYLAENLNGVSGEIGIVVQADDVTLDLSGFAVIGGGVSSDGILLSGHNISVVHGQIRGWSGEGIVGLSAANARFRDLGLHDNGGTGLRAGTGASIVNCAAYRNGEYGIFANLDGLIDNCVAQENGLAGIYGNQTTIRGCSANSNTNAGFSASGCVVSDCTARNNQGPGIDAGSGSISSVKAATVIGCNATQNDGDGLVTGANSLVRDCTAAQNGGDGIAADVGSRVTDCTVRSNVGDGIRVTTNCTVANCVSTLNDGSGIRSGDRGRIRDNECHDHGNEAGIMVSGAGGCIENNHVTGCDVGLSVVGTNVQVSANRVYENQANYDFTGENRLNLLLSEIPQSIDWPARVTLAGSLVIPSATDGITVSANDVTIDLGGHALLGIGGVASLDGIATSGTISNLVVRNGSARGWGGTGVNANNADHSRFEGLALEDNGSAGLKTGEDAVVRRCTARSNGAVGLDVQNYGLLSHCSASRNGGRGIEVGAFALVAQCQASQNGSIGVFASSGSSIQYCVANGNGSHGIAASSDCSVLHCTARSNGEDGINSVAACLMEGNTCNNNGTSLASAAGIRLAGEDAWARGNLVEGNPFGIVVSDNDSLLTANMAAKSTTGTNYNFIGTGMDYGEILTEPGANFINSNPWANFEQN